MKKITPRLLKGFRDFAPDKQEKRMLCINILQEMFHRQGFQAMDTPILEYEDILLGKGGDTDKQVYRFQDAGKRNVAMRFDLTMPFARFVSMNKNTLPIPFFRTQIGKVFRGENTQKGRYREFMQCDFDIIGLDYASLDFTIVNTIIASFQALQIENIKIHISHRGILNEFLSKKYTEKHNTTTLSLDEICIETLRIIDKIRKIGEEEIRTLLSNFWDEDTTNSIITLVTKESDNELTLKKLFTTMSATSTSSSESHSESHSKSLQRLQTIYEIAKDIGIENTIVIDPSITRGLDYYTGFVCETFIVGYEDIGSVCSGGRYNNLTQMFDEQPCPGVGASIGLDRLLAILEEMRDMRIHTGLRKIIIMSREQDALSYCHKVQRALQNGGFSALVYPVSGELKQFFKYTEKVNADFVCIIGSDELESKTITVKNQSTRNQISKVSIDDAIVWMKQDASQ